MKAPQVPRIGQDGERYKRTYTRKSLESLKMPPSLGISLQQRKSHSLNLTPERSQDIRNPPNQPQAVRPGILPSMQAVKNRHTLSHQPPSEADQETHLIEHVFSRLIRLQVSMALSQEASNEASVSPVSLSTAKERPGITLHRQRVEHVDPKARAMKGKGQGTTINPRSLKAHHSPRRKLTNQVRNALRIRELTDLGTNGHIQTASAHIHADKDHGKSIKGQAPLCTLTSDPKRPTTIPPGERPVLGTTPRASLPDGLHLPHAHSSAADDKDHAEGHRGIPLTPHKGRSAYAHAPVGPSGEAYHTEDT
jgi:hypothetical protein